LFFWTREDHIEVKIGLLSLNTYFHALLGLASGEPPVENAAEDDVLRYGKDSIPFSLDRDAQALESRENTVFHCKNCSSKLTKAPFRRIMELPSADWRELADHWYGNCCCASFGMKTESLIAQFQQSLTLSEGTCLVASTTCIVHHNDIVEDKFDKKVLQDNGGDCHGSANGCLSSDLKEDKIEDLDLNSASKVAFVKNGQDLEKLEELRIAEDHHVSRCTEASFMQRHFCEPRDCCNILENEDWVGGRTLCTKDILFEKDQENMGAVLCSDVHMNSGCTEELAGCRDEPFCHSRESEAKARVKDSEVSMQCSVTVQHGCKDLAISTHQACECSTVEDQHGDSDFPIPCCRSSNDSADLSNEFLDTRTGSESLGNGFMTGPGGPPEVSNWEPFFCNVCSYLVGAHSRDTQEHTEKGVHLFKCQISSHDICSSSLNVFRQHTLERVFTHELLSNSEGNSSYRYVVRGFKTRAPLLQLVLLNHDSWVCSGACNKQWLTKCEAASEAMETHQASPVLDMQLEITQSLSTEYSSGLRGQALHATLKPVVKFMYCDCSTFATEELSLIDKWAQLQQADDVYMLEEVVELLTSSLQANQLNFPPSCGSFQQFGLSYLEK